MPTGVVKLVLDDVVVCVIPSYLTLNVPPAGRLCATNVVVALLKQDVELENATAVDSPALMLPLEGTGEYVVVHVFDVVEVEVVVELDTFYTEKT